MTAELRTPGSPVEAARPPFVRIAGVEKAYRPRGRAL